MWLDVVILDVLFVWLDLMCFLQVVINLLSNVCYYGKGFVSFELFVVDGYVWLCVVNLVELIVEVVVVGLFDLFKCKLMDNVCNNLGSMGLGFYIVYQIVQVQGGFIVYDVCDGFVVFELQVFLIQVLSFYDYDVF